MVQPVRRARRFGGLMFALWLALLLPVLAPALHAQAVPPRAGVEGTVLDPESKAVVGAAVVIRSEASGAIVTTMTSPQYGTTLEIGGTGPLAIVPPIPSCSHTPERS